MVIVEEKAVVSQTWAIFLIFFRHQQESTIRASELSSCSFFVVVDEKRKEYFSYQVNSFSAPMVLFCGWDVFWMRSVGVCLN